MSETETIIYKQKYNKKKCPMGEILKKKTKNYYGVCFALVIYNWSWAYPQMLLIFSMTTHEKKTSYFFSS